MDMFNASIIGVDFKDMVTGSSTQHIFSEVVLIDRTHEGAKPLLFQLNDSTLVAEEDCTAPNWQGYITMRDNLFTAIGTVESINREKKQIRFKLEISQQKDIKDIVSVHTVSYRHLIITSGSEQDENELSAALIALIDALKIGKKIPSILENIATPYAPVNSKPHKVIRATQDDGIESLAVPRITPGDPASLAIGIIASHKRLYEMLVSL